MSPEKNPEIDGEYGRGNGRGLVGNVWRGSV